MISKEQFEELDRLAREWSDAERNYGISIGFGDPGLTAADREKANQAAQAWHQYLDSLSLAEAASPSTS